MMTSGGRDQARSARPGTCLTVAFALPRTHRVSTPKSTALGRLLGRAGLSDVTRRDSPHFSTTFTCALFPGVLRWVA